MKSPGSQSESESDDETVETARRAALVSWISVAISLLALFLVNGLIP